VNELDFRARTAVVTGGAAGIGFAVAQRLAASSFPSDFVRLMTAAFDAL